MEIPNFVGASYRQTAREVDVEDLVNMYPEIQESPGAKARIVLYGSPGLIAPPPPTPASVGPGPGRGLLGLEDYTSLVSGGFYFRLKPDGSFDNPAGAAGNPVANDGTPVSMVADTTQVLITSGGIAYVHNGGGFAPVANPPWTRAADCAYQDGYFIVLDDSDSPIGGQFFVSSINDATTWSALDFSTSPSSNNKLLALATDHDELWVYGSKVTQPFYNPGTPQLFPFVPNTTAVVMQGIENRATRVNLDNTLYWLGRNEQGTLQAFMAQGYLPKRISTHAIEQQWQKYQNPSDCTAWAYQLNGHPTYHLNFNTDQVSWRYDQATTLWHRVAYRNTVTNKGQCHRGSSHCMRLGYHLLQDRTTGNLWQMSPSVFADGPDPLVAMRRAPAIFKDNKMIFYSNFELLTQYGIGDGSNGNPQNGSVSPEQNPTWMLRWSSDNGYTWSNEYLLSSGAQGEYATRVRKPGPLGAARARVFEVSISAAVPRTIVGATADIEVGLS